ncbi:MAG: hypothetical protein QW054_06390, partial [Candidatus Micrarchaeia archaeon]
PDLVKNDYNGYLFKPHDVKGCAEAVIKCIKNKERLSKNAVKIAKEHSIEKTLKRHIEIYNQLLNENEKR